jgi:integrase
VRTNLETLVQPLIPCVFWEKPKCHVVRKFPFIPTEAELDALISGIGKRTATFLELLKQTTMRSGEAKRRSEAAKRSGEAKRRSEAAKRSGEAKRLEWTNIDFEKCLITLNRPEKGSNLRIWKVEQKLMSMLNALPRDSTRVFGSSSIYSMKTTFIRARKRLSLKLANPRLLKISFHTFRHWKATMLYHQTKDPYYVRDFVGRKGLRNTEIYINIERIIFEPGNNDFTVRVVEKPEDMKALLLLETGFEYVCQKDNLVFLRKRR